MENRAAVNQTLEEPDDPRVEGDWGCCSRAAYETRLGIVGSGRAQGEVPFTRFNTGKHAGWLLHAESACDVQGSFAR